MRATIEAELARSREIISGGVEIAPRFTISTPEGVVTIFVQLPDDLAARERRMQLVSDFMAVRMATSFVLATEMIEPDASVAFGISRDSCEAALQVITRSPLTFGPVAWLERGQIGDELPALLPAKVAAVTPEQVAAVDELIRHNVGIRFERP